MVDDVFPYAGADFDRDGLRMHYVDVGSGQPVVMVHGNPTWGVYYRRLIAALEPTHRCIVPDHIGMGRSEKPGDDRYSYTLASRVDALEALLDRLGVVENITLVVHDWGGMIGMAYAVRHPERIARLVVMNTSIGHLPEGKRFPPALALTRTPLGAFLVRGFNAFSAAASRVCCTRHPMSPEIRAAYRAPYDSWANRIATLRFVQDIPLKPSDPSYAIVTEVEDNAYKLAEIPKLICWGLRDFVFSYHFLEKWIDAYPDAEVQRFEDCGHYILEDATDEVVPVIQRFLARHPVAAKASA